MFKITAVSLAALMVAVTSPALAQDAGFRFEDVTDTHLPESPGANTMDVVSVDLDGDGDLDLVTAQEWLTNTLFLNDGVGSSRVDLQACKLEYSIVSPK